MISQQSTEELHDRPEKPILLVGASFYPHFLSALESGAGQFLKKMQIPFDIIHVPGALEIPGAIAQAEKSGRFGGYVALGVVIRGETSHYDTVCHLSAEGLLRLSLRGVCLGNGIVTVENEQQAWDRCLPHRQNKGEAATRACLSLTELKARYDLDRK